MKKILFKISILSLFLPSGISANDKVTVRYVDTGDGSPDHFIYRENTATNTNTLLFTLPAYGPGSGIFDSNGWTSYTDQNYLDNFSADKSFIDSYNSKLYLYDTTESTFVTYDFNTGTQSQVSAGSATGTLRGMFQVPSGLSTVISTGTDAEDGSSTTILGSLDISDANGNTLIENKSDGSVHIGENSLVTQEVNGVQQLYATNSAGNQIDLNIKSGTNLLIGGRNIMDIIGGDISGSVALSSALAALPNSSPDAFYTCGLGTGIHDSSSALSAGCASDFSNYAFVDKMPKIFQTASFNIGSSFLMNGEPDISEARDMSIKAGITFKFGSVKPTRVADKNNYMLENKIDAVMQENRKLKAQLKEENDSIRQENDLLKAQIAEINTQLKALNMLAMN